MLTRTDLILQLTRRVNNEEEDKENENAMSKSANILPVTKSNYQEENNIDRIKDWLNSSFNNLPVQEPLQLDDIEINNSLDDGKVLTNLTPLIIENNINSNNSLHSNGPITFDFVKNTDSRPEVDENNIYSNNSLYSNGPITFDSVKNTDSRPEVDVDLEEGTIKEPIKIISNIVINAGKIENSLNKTNASVNEQPYSESIISESVCDDNFKDKDFDINEYGDSSNDTDNAVSEPSSSISGELRNLVIDTIPNSNEINSQPLSEQIRERINSKKKNVCCKFCDEDVVSKNFMRHLERHHGYENEVQGILQYPLNSKARRQALSLLRNATNFDLYITGTVRPNRIVIKESDKNTNYYPCAYCKGLFLKSYLKRHAKKCIPRKSTFISNQTSDNNSHLSQSQTLIACAIDPTETISKLNVKKQVFDMMKGDEIAYEAKKDLLIAHFGESYLKKHKKERMTYACSNRMRELSRLLIRYRKVINKGDVTFKELLHPKNFDNVILATREIVGYNPEKKTFKTPSLAMHLGTSLKMACDELSHLVLKESKGFKCKSSEEAGGWLKNIRNFKKIVESRWNLEISSLAHKDLQEKRWNKPLLLPLVGDIKKFREECMTIASNCEKLFSEERDDVKTYTSLVQCTLALVIIFNRRRIGDVQFLKIQDYNNENKSNFADFQNVLTETEKMLTTKYKRIVNSGKGSREVVILIPEILQNYINLLLKHRGKYILPDNEYVFATPGSKIKWGKGDVAIRTLAKNMKLENPQAITSNKLRKQIATVMQLLNLTQEETKQFSTFMGHTQKTHEEFYELPIDIYQTAKVSKMLLLMEKGSVPLEYKGKSLADINFDSNLEYAMESDNDDDGILNSEPSHESCVAEELTRASSSHDKNFLNSSNTENDCDIDIPANGNMDYKEIENSSPKISRKKKVSHKKDFDETEENDHEDQDISPKRKKKKKKVSHKKDFDETEESDCEDQDGPKKKPIKKRGWSYDEITSIKREFISFIKKKTYPSGEELKEFIKKKEMNRTVPVLKAKLQHLMKTL